MMETRISIPRSSSAIRFGFGYGNENLSMEVSMRYRFVPAFSAVVA